MAMTQRSYAKEVAAAVAVAVLAGGTSPWWWTPLISRLSQSEACVSGALRGKVVKLRYWEKTVDRADTAADLLETADAEVRFEKMGNQNHDMVYYQSGADPRTANDVAACLSSIQKLRVTPHDSIGNEADVYVYLFTD